MKNVIPSLNGLRAISIIMVIAGHFNLQHFFTDNKILKYLGFILFNGALGVNVFFIISGFLITILLIEEKKKNGYISLKDFYIRRTLRIFPAYYFLLLVYYILQVYGLLDINRLGWISVLTYTKQFYDGGPHEIGHLWSLSVEELFYLIWPFIFINYKGNIEYVVWAGIIFITLMRMYLFDFPVTHFSHSIFTTGDALLIGCLIALKHESIQYYILDKKKYIYLLSLLLVIFIFTYVTLFYLLNKEGRNNSYLFYLVTIAYGFIGNIGLFSNLILAYIIVYSINIRNLWSKFLNLPIMNHIGKLSYSIYLYQELLTSDKPCLHKIPLFLLIATIYLLALLSYNLIEKPFLKLKKRFATK